MFWNDSVESAYPLWRHHCAGGLAALVTSILRPALPSGARRGGAPRLWGDHGSSDPLGALAGRAHDSEIYAALCPGGVFCNLEHVAPVSAEFHRRFLEALGTAETGEDLSNRLVSAEVQLHWLREIGIRDVGLSLEMAGAGASGRGEAVMTAA